MIATGATATIDSPFFSEVVLSGGRTLQNNGTLSWLTGYIRFTGAGAPRHAPLSPALRYGAGSRPVSFRRTPWPATG